MVRRSVVCNTHDASDRGEACRVLLDGELHAGRQQDGVRDTVCDVEQSADRAAHAMDDRNGGVVEGDASFRCRNAHSCHLCSRSAGSYGSS